MNGPAGGAGPLARAAHLRAAGLPCEKRRYPISRSERPCNNLGPGLIHLCSTRARAVRVELVLHTSLLLACRMRVFQEGPQLGAEVLSRHCCTSGPTIIEGAAATHALPRSRLSFQCGPNSLRLNALAAQPVLARRSVASERRLKGEGPAEQCLAHRRWCSWSALSSRPCSAREFAALRRGARATIRARPTMSNAEEPSDVPSCCR